MKQAVITTGGQQYLVSEGDVIDVDLLGDKKTITFAPLFVTDGKETSVGTPEVSGVKVSAKVLEEVKDDKVVAIRYKAKKRVHKTQGHRQRYSRIQITSIS